MNQTADSRSLTLIYHVLLTLRKLSKNISLQGYLTWSLNLFLRFIAYKTKINGPSWNVSHSLRYFTKRSLFVVEILLMPWKIILPVLLFQIKKRLYVTLSQSTNITNMLKFKENSWMKIHYYKPNPIISIFCL